MLRKADEGLHHSAEQVSEALAEARRICEAHGVTYPEHEQIVCALMQHLLSKQVVFEQISRAGVLMNNRPMQ